MLFKDIALNLLENASEEISPFTKRSYYYCLQKIFQYAPELHCEQINTQFVKDYRTYLIERGNKPATIAKGLSVLRNFSHKLMAEGIIQENPFAGIKIKRVCSHRQFLNIHDLRKLFTRFIEHESILRIPERNALRAFLFSCFTGLRYSDLKSLTYEEIKDGKIRKQMHKTGNYVYIPIPRQAMALIAHQKEGKVLKVSENSYFNKFLRSGASRLGISQRLHCHLARHTFATTCLYLDIPLAVTSKLLGHREISTTLIYAKYVDTILDKEMRKFNKL